MDLGLDLLMNPTKKNIENMSSRASSVKDAPGSVRSIKLDSIKNEDIQSMIFERVKVDELSDADKTSESSYQSSFRQQPRPQQFRARPAPSEREEAESYAESDGESLGSLLAKGGKRQMTEEEILAEKREMLYQFDRIEKKGFKLPKKFTLASNLEEMRLEYERVKNDRAMDNAVKFQRKAVILLTSGIELLNSKYDPFNVKLTGWSESVHEDIDEYDDIFEELYEKYRGKANMAPELRLLLGLGGSAFMFHMTNSLFRNAPELGDVLKNNPNLRRQFAEATANTMKSQAESGGGGGGLFGNIAGMFGNMFAGGGNAPPPQPPPQPAGGAAQRPTFNMKGPSNMEDILKDMENDNNRIEVMSTVTSSEFTELNDDVSIHNLISSKKGRKKTNVMSLDI